jgi:hypothetical protein
VVVVVEPGRLGFAPTSRSAADAVSATVGMDALVECARECTARAESCFERVDFPDLAACGSAALDCADLCQTVVWAVSRSNSRTTTLARSLVLACAAACRACVAACETHAGRHGHRRSCDRACRRAEQACNELLDMLT